MFLVCSSTAQAAMSSSRLPAALHVTRPTETPARVIQSSRWKYQAQTGLLASWEPKCLESLESKIVFSFFFTLPRQAQKIKWTEAIFKNNYKTACFWVKTCICQAVAKNLIFNFFFQALKLWQQYTLIEPTILSESINMCMLLMWVLLFSLSVSFKLHKIYYCHSKESIFSTSFPSLSRGKGGKL